MAALKYTEKIRSFTSGFWFHTEFYRLAAALLVDYIAISCIYITINHVSMQEIASIAG